MRWGDYCHFRGELGRSGRWEESWELCFWISFASGGWGLNGESCDPGGAVETKPLINQPLPSGTWKNGRSGSILGRVYLLKYGSQVLSSDFSAQLITLDAAMADFFLFFFFFTGVSTAPTSKIAASDWLVI